MMTCLNRQPRVRGSSEDGGIQAEFEEAWNMTKEGAMLAMTIRLRGGSKWCAFAESAQETRGDYLGWIQVVGRTGESYRS